MEMPGIGTHAQSRQPGGMAVRPRDSPGHESVLDGVRLGLLGRFVLRFSQRNGKTPVLKCARGDLNPHTLTGTGT